MEKLNEYKLTDNDINRWRETWDGKWESIPMNIHEYVLTGMKENSDRAEKILKQLLSAG